MIFYRAENYSKDIRLSHQHECWREYIIGAVTRAYETGYRVPFVFASLALDPLAM